MSVKSICHSLISANAHIRVHRAGILTDSFEALKAAWLLRLKIEGSCAAEHSNLGPFAMQNDYVIRVRAGHKVSNQRAST